MAGAHVEQKTDGYVHVNKVSVASVAVSKPGVYMCDCKAYTLVLIPVLLHCPQEIPYQGHNSSTYTYM